MSLLMDALRKAEEAKKQAEQEKSAGDNSSQAAAPAPVEPVQPIEEKASSAEPEPSKRLSPDLSVMLEFDGESSSTSDTLSPAAGASTLSDDLDKAIETASQSLEAKAHNGTDTAPLAESLETAAPAADSSGADDFESFLGDAVATGEIAAPIHTPEIELPLIDDADGIDKKAPVKPEKNTEGAIEYTSPSSTAEPKQAAAGPNYTQNKPASIRAERAPESIAERTAQSRQSAKSVFAAKRINANNRKAYIYGGSGIAAAAVLALGYFMFSSVPSGNTFTIPQGDYLSANEADYANETAGNIERVDQAGALVALEPEPGSVDVSSQTGLISSPDPAAVPPANADLAVDQIAQDSGAILAGLNITATLSQTAEPESSPANLDPPEVLVENEGPVVLAETAPAEVPAESSTSDNRAGTIKTAAQTPPAREDGFNLSANFNAVADDSATDLISFSKKASRPVVSPQLNDAYSAYQLGNLDLALTLYDQVLQEDPRNIDALLGKAAISSAQGEISQAMSLYSNILNLNPSQAIARSGLLNLVPSVNSADQERQLRRLISDYPNVAPLAFALGNFYAAQSRWIDAQKNYFNALSLAKAGSATGALVSPDYAFNLAVSLDRLNQPGPATTYYQEALTLASQYPSNFDLGVARSRIDKLIGSFAP